MNRFPAIAIASLLVLSSVASARAEHAGGPTYKVGVTYRAFRLTQAYDWRGAKTHALLATVWYPAAPESIEERQWIVPGGPHLFEAGSAAVDARVAPSPKRFPFIVLSHGTGGSALQMAWLGTVLASHGYIAAAVNHPGNNALEPYTARGFSTWWERARDLSAVIDGVLADSTFGRRVDPGRIGAAGFSLGGYTMIAIAGGITDPNALFEFCKSPRADSICTSPPEFPTLFTSFQQLAKSDPEFQRALRHAGDSNRDSRVRAVFAMAPALGPAFPAAGLANISIPVQIVAGAADTNVPVASSAKYFAAHIKGAKLTLFPGGVAHYVFLDLCVDNGRRPRSRVCADAPHVDRSKIHAETAKLAFSFFDNTLK